MRRALLALIPVLAAPAVARADATSSVTVTLSPGGQAYAATLGLTPEQLSAQVKAGVEEAYQTNNVEGFLQDFTDATAFSTRGIGVDYGSTPRSVMFGFAANVAAAGDKTVFDEAHPTAGLAANLAVMVGLNLDRWKLPRWSLYANGFYRKGSTDQLKGDITSLGAHVQYRVIPAQAGGGGATVVRWLGLNVTSGAELTKWNLRTQSAGIDTDVAIAGNAQSGQVVLNSTGKFDLTSTAVTVPVELTTAIQIAVLASVYAGVGVDFTAGKSTVAASLAGTLNESTHPDLGTVAITADGTGNASPAAPRALVGVQFNLTALRIFAQANLSATPAASVAFGIRLVF